MFSSFAGYLLGIDKENPFSLKTLIYLLIGGYCMVGASNAYNQVIEKDYDKLMDRTKDRPIPSEKMSEKKALCIAILLTIFGIILLYLINTKAAFFGVISIFLYVCVYTPLKNITPLSVFVGAFPGAIPFMLGWIAATDHFGIEAGTLFLIQFLWQFPHFWAIGWLFYDDYAKAGFFMLPTTKKDKATALQIILYTLWLILASLLPFFKITGKLFLTPIGAFFITLIGIWMLIFAIKLYQIRSTKAAKNLLIVSVFYISLLQIIYILDKFLR